MFSTCLFCHGALGTNEVLEHFPVGRRLAFDADQGRLWVVCPSCERWNLTPLEERWEAIEEAERQHRRTTRRVATDNIALARLPEGLELVRIGRPLRPEFAAWRYGDQFGRRRRRAWAYGAGTVAVSVASWLSPLGVTIGLGLGAAGLLQAAYYGLQWHHMRTAVVQVRDADGRAFRLSRADVIAARLFVSPGTPVLTLQVQRWGAAEPWLARLGARERLHFGIAEIVLRGDSVPQALAAVLPALNSAGGKPALVEQAVRVIADAGSTTRLLRLAHTGPRRKILFHRPAAGRKPRTHRGESRPRQLNGGPRHCTFRGCGTTQPK